MKRLLCLFLGHRPATQLGYDATRPDGYRYTIGTVCQRCGRGL